MARIAGIDASPPSSAWAPCAACWGQGRIYCRGDDRRLRPVACYGCLGVGQTLDPWQEGGADAGGFAPR